MLLFGTQNENAKSIAIKKISKIVRQQGWDYSDFRYIIRRVREECELKPAKKEKRLPKILSEQDFKKFYNAIEKAGNIKYELMLKLLFYTGVRVHEFTNIKVSDIYLDENKIFIEQGKGKKDRYVLFGEKFKTALKIYKETIPNNRYLFQTKRDTPYSTRRIQQIVKSFAEEVGIKATPHTFRHQAITWLSQGGMTDAELMLITGHSSKESLKIYQHMALTKGLEKKYQEAMGQVGF
ncbi:tyrosine-type recombinase/integrase [Patescibacteria group bacterium]